MVQSLAMVATQFLDRPGLADSTLRSYESALIPLLAEYGSVPIELIDRQSIQAYLDEINHLSYRTHHRHQAIIHALFRFAVSQGFIHTNPIAHLQRRKPDRAKGEHSSDQPIRYLNESQLQDLYQSVRRDTRLNALVHLLHSTGARISEILALELDEIDQYSYKFQVIGKGNKTRWCFYNERTQKALERYFRYSRHASISALFTAQHRVSKAVTRLSYRTAHATFKKAIVTQASLHESRLHDLRHTFATERVGIVSLEELRALMGHESIQTTLKYQKVTSQQAERAAQKAFKQLA